MHGLQQGQVALLEWASGRKALSQNRAFSCLFASSYLLVCYLFRSNLPKKMNASATAQCSSACAS